MQVQVPSDHIRRDTLAALEDFVLPSFKRAIVAIGEYLQAFDQESFLYSSALPAFMIACRDLNLYRAGVASGAFLALGELGDASIDLDNAHPAFADIAVNGFDPIELRPNLSVLEKMVGQDVESITPMTDAVAAQSTSAAIYASFATNVWFGCDPDLLEFLARCLTPDESAWSASLNRASERFYSDFDDCFCCRPWTERLSRAGTDEPSYNWLFNGAVELLSQIAHVEAMLANPYAATSGPHASVYENLDWLPYRVLGVDGLLPLSDPLIDRRIIQALRQVWRTVAVTLPPRSFREVMRTPLEHSSDRVRDLLERSGAYDWVTGVPWNQQGVNFEPPPHSHP